MSGAPLLPDEAGLARWVRVLFKRADPVGWLALRVWPQADGPTLHEEGVLLGASDLAERLRFVAFKAANLPMAAVFAPPACTFKNGFWARAVDLFEGPVLAVDADARPVWTLAALRAVFGDPTLVVSTGGLWTDPETGEIQERVHCFWRLARPARTAEEHQDLRTARKLACDLVASDASAVSTVHPLRISGSWHKKAAPRLARVVEENDAVEIDLGDTLRMLRALPDDAFARRPSKWTRAKPNPDKTADSEDVAAALRAIPNRDWPWDEWVQVGMAAWMATGGDWHGGFQAFDAWSEQSWKYDPEKTVEQWDHFYRSPPERIGAGTLFWLARKYSPGWVKPSARVDPEKWHETVEEPQDREAEQPNAGGLFGDDRRTEPDPPAELHPIDPTRYQGLSIPARRWLVRDWIPWGSVTGLYGEGGLGKTLIAQQLQTAAAVGRSWLGLETAAVRSLGVYCEDSEEELWRRQADIDRLYGCDFKDLAAARWLPRATEDNVLVTFGKDGSLQLTAFHAQIIKAARDHKAEFVILDTASDVFTGNENDRGQVKRFVSHGLGSLAQEIGGSILVLLHPSRAGIASGTGDSGSTAWNGAFRSRLSLEVPSQEKGDRPDPDARELVRKKANYAARGDIIALHWRNGVLAVNGQPAGQNNPQRPCADVFLDLLDRMTRLGRPVSDRARAGNFAPKAFAQLPDAEGYRPTDFQRAMERLFSAGQIRVEDYGRKADLRQRIVRVTMAAAA